MTSMRGKTLNPVAIGELEERVPDYTIREFYVFRIELRDTIDAALDRLATLEGMATKWVTTDIALTREPGDADFGSPKITTVEIEALNSQRSAQTLIFETLEDFLARWARVSNILYPNQKRSTAAQRGARLRRRLSLPDKPHDHILGNRHLRDAWAHFDERLDACLASGRLAWPQWFDQSRSITSYYKENIPRLFVLDTLELYYHSRNGQVECGSLRAMKDALAKLRDTLWSSTVEEVVRGEGV